MNNILNENDLIFGLLLISIIACLLFEIYFFYKNLKFKKVVEKLVDKKVNSKYAMYHDATTHLPNRISFLKDIDEYVTKGKKCSVMLFDIDNFKKINDAFGHSTGDLVLKIIADRIQKIDVTDFRLYRYAGDEFGLILDTNDDIMITEIASRIHEKINEPFYLNKQNLILRASLGIACYPDDGESVDDLVSHADLAQGYVKGNGKASSAFYRSYMQKEIQEQVEIEKPITECN